ncbi:unnamed protein product [Phytophthora lilii]|uniref:Unnamed protein product n=1 Tax=Phytophthora lilii TaxID=2077276 RepID=A0A9W6WER8_9STRA|nr:unnamed protein product [Phytophthora lilii]
MAGEEEMAAGSADAVDNSTDAQARGMESGGVEASSSSDHDSQSSSETETQMPDEVPNTQVDAAKAPRATTEARIANHDEEAKSGSADLVYSSDDSMEDISSDADDACNPLLMGVVPPSKTVDVQVNTLVHSRRRNYLYFQQWKGKLNGKAAHTRLRLALEELLPRVSVDSNSAQDFDRFWEQQITTLLSVITVNRG